LYGYSDAQVAGSTPEMMGTIVMADDASDCQEKCQKDDSCAYFEYRTVGVWEHDAGSCILKTQEAIDGALAQHVVPNSTSGTDGHIWDTKFCNAVTGDFDYLSCGQDGFVCAYSSVEHVGGPKYCNTVQKTCEPTHTTTTTTTSTTTTTTTTTTTSTTTPVTTTVPTTPVPTTTVPTTTTKVTTPVTTTAEPAPKTTKATTSSDSTEEEESTTGANYDAIYVGVGAAAGGLALAGVGGYTFTQMSGATSGASGNVSTNPDDIPIREQHVDIAMEDYV